MIDDNTAEASEHWRSSDEGATQCSVLPSMSSVHPGHSTFRSPRRSVEIHRDPAPYRVMDRYAPLLVDILFKHVGEQLGEYGLSQQVGTQMKQTERLWILSARDDPSK